MVRLLHAVAELHDGPEREESDDADRKVKQVKHWTLLFTAELALLARAAGAVSGLVDEAARTSGPRHQAPSFVPNHQTMPNVAVF